jgi:DNA modification methylase
MTKKFDHPAMFPSELPRRLIEQLTYEDDVILDPFSGAGTTCCVAKEMGRKYIGIEMSEKYWKTSLKRIGEIPEKNGNMATWME